MTPRHATWQTGRKADSSSTKKSLLYSQGNVKVIESEKSLLVTCKVLRLLVNTLTADDKYFLLSRDNSMEAVQMHLSEKQKTFSEFSCAFLKFTSNFEHFQKNITLIAYEFPKLRIPKNLVR